jgi:hypothetical protein
MIYTVEDMKDEIRAALNEGESISDVRDQISEYVDTYLPIYNNEIIEEWQNMPGEYDDRGAAELGDMGETTIIGLMSLDLYIYYTELFNSALDSLVEEIIEGGE